MAIFASCNAYLSLPCLNVHCRCVRTAMKLLHCESALQPLCGSYGVDGILSSGISICIDGSVHVLKSLFIYTDLDVHCRPAGTDTQASLSRFRTLSRGVLPLSRFNGMQRCNHLPCHTVTFAQSPLRCGSVCSTVSTNAKIPPRGLLLPHFPGPCLTL